MRKRTMIALPIVLAVVIAAGLFGTNAVLAATAVRVALPPAGGRADYQLGGPYPPVAGVRIVTRDRTAKAAAGVYSICYINAFQTQPDEAAFWKTHTDLVLQSGGRPVTDPDWPGERILDISTAAKRSAIAAIEGRWIDGCAKLGFRAIEPDNLDTYTRFPKRLTQGEALAFAKLLATRSHVDGLAIAQKNDAELGSKGRTSAGFDFAVAEECQVYGECGSYTAAYGRHVIEIEYTDTPRRYFTAACAARGTTISVLLRDRDVVPRGSAGYRYEVC